MTEKKTTGIPIVLSAASGTGKTTLGHKLRLNCPGITLSISYTTRAPRKGETHGVDYFFVDNPTFDAMLQTQAFLEWAEVHGHRYGTAWSEVTHRLNAGEDVLLDIDVQGGKQIRQRYASSLLIFLLPPSLRELMRRLRQRGTESDADFQRRMIAAKREIEEASIYDYLVVNDNLNHATEQLAQIVKAERLRRIDKNALIERIVRDH